MSHAERITVMPLIRDGKEYLNTSEAAEYMEVSFITFKDIVQKQGLKGVRFIGQGQQKFYLKDDLERLKNQSLPADDES